MKVVKVFLSLLFLTIMVSGAFIYWLYDDWNNSVYVQTIESNAQERTDEDTLFVVSAGESIDQVIDSMRQNSLLENTWKAKLAVRVFEPGLLIKQGRYRIPQKYTLPDFFELLSSGVSINYSLTIVEGQSLLQALEKMFESKLFTDDFSVINENNNRSVIYNNFLSGVLEPEAIAMMPSAVEFEGWFFPDTYFVEKASSVYALLKRSHLRLLAVLKEEWDNRAEQLPYKTPYEALVMASLIERETGVGYERAKIAGVFVRRLEKRMRLQTDPSVIYGLGESFDGNLRRADLKRDTPYNTYTRHGLPPTPIALVGREAINAALHPEHGSALFFVAKGDGTHYFSDTLEEHQAAVKRYQLSRRADYRSSPPKTVSQ